MNLIDYKITLGRPEDLDELTNLYNDLNDFLAQTQNFPGWIKGIYPIRETAFDGINSGFLYVLKISNRIAGTVILNSTQPEAYDTLTWEIQGDDEEILVVHTLAVHHDFFKYGIASKLLNFAENLAKEKNMKTIRLDTYHKNLPAMKLYKKTGYTLVGKVDLGLKHLGLELFNCYEKEIGNY